MRIRQDGFTLLEVLIASSILASLLLISMTVMMAMADASAELKGEAYASQVAGRTVEEIISLIRQTNAPPVLASATTNDYRFQVPVDADEATPGMQLVGATGLPVYGADGKAGEYYSLKFIPSGREYAEPLEGVSINVDGDTMDVYEFGRIRLGFCTDLTSKPHKTVDLTTDIVLRYKSAGATGGETTLLTDNEPLMQGDGTTEVDVTVMTADFSSERPALRKAQGRVRLRNASSSE